MSKTSTRTRDARTGKFVPNKEAERRPSTTVRETVKVGPTKKRSWSIQILEYIFMELKILNK